MRISDWSSDVCSSDLILESILSRLGNLERALLLDDYAEGKDSGIIDLCLIGDIERNSLRDLTEKSERYLNRKIRTLVLTKDEYTGMREGLKNRPHMMLWESKRTTPKPTATRSARAQTPNR